MTRARRWLVAGAALAAGLACADTVTPPDGGGARAPITVSATLTPAQQATIAGMSVEVTGSGISTPIIATLSVTGATVNGTVQVPVGASRTFTVRAFDAQGAETYNGSATANVVAGTNPALTVRLTALQGSVPIDVTIGTYGVSLTPSTASVAVDGEVTLAASVTSNGASVPSALTWGALNPALVTVAVAADGRSAVVRGRIAGTTRVVASYQGYAAASTVTITGGATNQPPTANANGPYTAAAGSAIQFSSAGSTDVDGTIVSWAWTFGDGTTSTQANPSKSYAAAGSYTATLLVTDDDGATATSSAAVTVTAPSVNGFALASIYTGSNHSCGLTAAGKAYCWGAGGVGQLGSGGTAVNVSRPVPVSMSNMTFTKMALGLAFSCGLTPAGDLYCWGTNSEGQLGIGSTNGTPWPTLVPGGTFSDIIAGDVNACGLRGTTWYCWGRNDAAQTGQPQTTPRVLSPTAVPSVAGETWASVALGLGHMCALSTTQAVYCWGNNTRGQLGSPTATAGPAPVRIVFPGATPPALVRIVAGHSYTCALESPSNAMWCWGENSRAQQAIPVSVPTTPHRVDGDFSGLVAGASFACAVGRSVCWGDDDFGELGDGAATATPRHTPGAIAGGAMQMIAPGLDNHMCGLRAGIAWCWGLNGAAQLGNGAITTQPTPTPTAVLTP